MSLEPPTYLNSLQNNIRARPIPWDGAVRAGNITDEHLRKIKAVDKVRKQERKQAVEADLSGYTTLLAGNPPDVKSVLDSASRRTDIVQYILVLAADLINGILLQKISIRTPLTTPCRCSCSCVGAHLASQSLQCIPTIFTEPHKPRRPYPSARIFILDESCIDCAHLRSNFPYRRGSSTTFIYIPGGFDEESG